MRKLVWFLAFVAAGLWSLFVWAGYAFLGWANEAMAGAPGAWGLPPDAALWLSWAGYLFEQVGQGAAIVLWVLGLGLIFGLAAVVGLFFGPRRRPDERFSSPERAKRRADRPDPPPPTPRAEPRLLDLPAPPPEPPRAPPVEWGRSAGRR